MAYAKTVVTDKGAYEAIQALRHVAKRFYVRSESPVWETTAATELRSSIRMFRAKLRKTANPREPHYYLGKFGGKICRLLGSKFGDSEAWGYYVIKGRIVIEHRHGRHYRDRTKVADIYPGFKITPCKDEAFIYKIRYETANRYGEIFAVQVLRSDGSMRDQYACKLRGEEEVRLLPQRSPESALAAAEKLFRDTFMARVEAAFGE